ncbi:hypothetical protein [Gymnodinialimonas hymeniacidonis]|uniref:hypothetical protein n=1 Tax=Gymnodinialimonas hymeniacidonis TaxID=3126508 RepID=UPI0034C5BDDB
MNKSGGVECLAWTWGIAALVGVFTAAALWVLGGWSFMQGAFMGVLVLLILGAILTITMCRAPATPHNAGSGQASAGGSSTAAKTAAATAPAAAAADTSAADAAREAEAAAAAEAEAARAAAAAEAEANAAAEAEAARAAEAEAAAAASAAAAAPAADPGPGTRPEALDGPRGGQADDLKRIKGVGPKMETLCNELGFYHFDQIAAWNAEEVAWVDQNLKGFKGRVSRDNWVEQASLLAAGGETEFSKKVDDGDVY